MLLRAAPPSGFIEPCLPSPADRPPSGPGWVHEIKHDGYRLMLRRKCSNTARPLASQATVARRDPAGIRLLTRKGHDWAARYPLIFEAVNRLKVRSCLIISVMIGCARPRSPNRI